MTFSDKQCLHSLAYKIFTKNCIFYIYRQDLSVLLFFSLQLKVYYGSLEVTKVEESPKYDLKNLVSGLGGALSLFLGGSFIMFFEIVEFFLRSLESLLHPKRALNAMRCKKIRDEPEVQT